MLLSQENRLGDNFPMEYKYQKGFYDLSERVRDPTSRRAKAEKIIWSLTRFVDLPLSSATCLDVGCSSGIITSYISRYFKMTIGLEYDETALKAIDPAARDLLIFIHGDAMALPIRDESVDVIICAQVYEHVPDDKVLFDEIYRVLKPGGVVFFSGPNWLFPIEPHYRLLFLHWLPRSWANRYLQFMRHGQYYYEHSRHFWDLRKILNRFEVMDISLEIILHHYLSKFGILGRFLAFIIVFLRPIVYVLVPNFNWILFKP